MSFVVGVSKTPIVLLHEHQVSLRISWASKEREAVQLAEDIYAFQLMVLANLLDDKVLQSELEDCHFTGDE